ncbi:ribonuclease Y-like [Prorops nasuta]|uniref:ribonuclease Y-like n=1 Tax=Prorops nasuta TaxID=863751 RepID=UPI0034CF4237
MEEAMESTEFSNKITAQWTHNAILCMLASYDANKDSLEHPKKKTHLWDQIVLDMDDLGFQFSRDQVRWKFNALHKSYKECVDNNSKSGRQLKNFKYYEEFDEIFGYKEKLSQISTFSSFSAKANVENTKKPTNISCSIGNYTILESTEEINKKNQDKEDHIIEKNITNNSVMNQSEELQKEQKQEKSKKIKKIGLEHNWEQYLDLLEVKQTDLRHRHNELLQKKDQEMKLKEDYISLKKKNSEIKQKMLKRKLEEKMDRHRDIIDIENKKYHLMLELLRKDKHN